MSFSRISASSVDTSVLGEPIRFRHGKTAKNRIMKSPLSEKMFNWDQNDEIQLGHPTEAIFNLYSHWAHGGFGLIMTGNMGVDPKFVGEAGQGLVSTENTSETSRKLLADLATIMKSEEALAVVQVNHVGRSAITDYINPLGEKHNRVEQVLDPLEYSVNQLEDGIFKRFSHAALELHQCGFDGMELHSAHGMIFSQFLSSKNQRTDEYGGPIENRARLLTETYKEIRKLVPESTGFLVGVKLNSVDFQAGGMSRDEIIKLCEIIESTGFDFVELSGGAMESVIKEVNMRESTVARENFFLDFVQFTSEIFKETAVYITGRWQTAATMVSSVKMGLTKGVGLGRWSCSEPNFPRKLIAGEIFSGPDNKFAPSEFVQAKHGAHWHMKQMSEKKYDGTISSTDLLTNFTMEEEVLNFKKACAAYKEEFESIGGQNSHAGVINYNPLRK